jgi:hypothetical protein
VSDVNIRTYTDLQKRTATIRSLSRRKICAILENDENVSDSEAAVAKLTKFLQTISVVS